MHVPIMIKKRRKRRLTEGEDQQLSLAGCAGSNRPSPVDTLSAQAMRGKKFPHYTISTHARVHKKVMKELTSLKEIEGPDPNYKDVCFSGVGGDILQLSKSFPAVDMVFRDGNKLSQS